MAEPQSTAQTYILFELAGTAYGIPSRDVQQMEMLEEITPVPNTAPFVEGVVLSRGQVVPALNLRRRFGFDRIPYDIRTRLVVTRSGERTVGLIVDTAREFVTIPDNAIQPPPEEIAGLSGKYLTGVAKLGERLILLLDVKAVLDTQ